MTAVHANDGAARELAIEPMGERHVPDVAAIEERTFDTPWTEGMFAQEVADSHLSRSWVFLINGRVVGYVISWFLRDEVHLLNIAIDGRYRGRGYGRRAMQHLVDEAAGGGRREITLEVRESNTPARRLYESFGFETVGRRRQYYQDDQEDAVVMRLQLTGRRGPA